LNYSQVNVHQSESRAMNFQERNFRYVKRPFGEFIEDIASGKLQYLRSLSKSDPVNSTANFTSDFASISEDFSLPTPLQLVTNNFHSSVLRISGPVAMWLHYDVGDVYNQQFSQLFANISR
jgi:tRNA wybutosine-synthesizing protein 4